MGSNNSLAVSRGDLAGEASTRTKTDGLDVRLFLQSKQTLLASVPFVLAMRSAHEPSPERSARRGYGFEQ